MAATPRTINVQDFLNENKFSGYQWMIFIICFLIAFFDGMDTAAIGYVAPSLLEEWGIEKSQLAPVLSAALFGLAIGAMTSGPLADKFGRKIVLTSSVLIFSGFCVASSFVHDLTQMTVLRFITGLGLGAAMPNAVAILSEYCPDHKRSLILNTMYCGFPVGAIKLARGENRVMSAPRSFISRNWFFSMVSRSSSSLIFNSLALGMCDGLPMAAICLLRHASSEGGAVV